MTKVINQYDMHQDFVGSIYYGETECCGEEVEKSVYGGDEECPKCRELLDWGYGN